MTYIIEDGIPLPPTPRNHPRTATSQAMARMEVGQSFAIASNAEWQQVRGRLSIMRPRRFSIRRQETGWRVWRIA